MEGVEAHVAAMDVEIRGLHQQMDALSASTTRNHGMLMSRLDDLVRDQRQSSRINPGWIASGLGLVSLAGALIGSQLGGLKATFEDHEGLSGHPETLVAMARADQARETLAAFLKATEEDVKRLTLLIDRHRVWMDENSNIDATQTQRINGVVEELEKVRVQLAEVRERRWTSEMGERSRDLIADLAARLGRVEVLTSEARREMDRRASGGVN